MADSTRKITDPDSLMNVEETETVHHESLRQKRKKKTPKKLEELNLTSMLDVCFQLLIFFVLTASFAKGEGYLPADLPAGSGVGESEDPPKQPLHIRLKSLGGLPSEFQINADTERVDNFNQLYLFLKRNQFNSKNPAGIYSDDNPIIIHAEGNVVFGHVLNTYNSAMRANYKNVNFAMPDQ